ncbi:MAG: hypothetical protein KAT46_00010 [Deltaproteobacteria bacterium]|nr:hypothetical protein [Deltaproteobacteria bacterium]
MKKNKRQNTTKMLGFTAFWYAIILCFLSTLAIFPTTTLAEESNIEPEKSPKPQQRTITVKGALEELYNNYEDIDKKLLEVKESIGSLKTGSFVTPILITVKKKEGFNLLYLEIKDKDTTVWSHIYSAMENSAIEQKTGQEFFKGATGKGTHTFKVIYSYRVEGSEEIRRGKADWKIKIQDDPIFLELWFMKNNKGVWVQPRRLNLLGRENAR